MPFLNHLTMLSPKCALSWWWTKFHKFPIVIKLAKHILIIPTSQIKTWKRIFSIARISTSFYKCHLQINNLHKLIFWTIIDHWIHTLIIESIWFGKYIWSKIWLKTKELEVEFDDEMKHEEFLEILSCYSSISIC
jgi:hypothetical protein